jgi:hypothetical protein
VLENPHLGSGTFSPIEIDADRLFDRIEATVASLILSGPSTDDDGWFWLLLDGEEG